MDKVFLTLYIKVLYTKLVNVSYVVFELKLVVFNKYENVFTVKFSLLCFPVSCFN